jgi:hypothetical protein
MLPIKTATDKDIDQPAEISPYIGTILTDYEDDVQSLLDATGVGVVRAGIADNRFQDFPKNSDNPFWQSLRKIIENNRHRQWLLTVPPTHDGFASNSKPPIPETKEDVESFRQFVIFLIEHYGQFVKYWQLGNELHTPKNWPHDRYNRFAELLSIFHDEVVSRVEGAQVVLGGFTGHASLDNPERPEPRQLLEVIARQAPQKVHLLDIHHHAPWRRGSFLGERIQRMRQIIERQIQSLAHVNFVVTECSTWSDKPLEDEPQTEREQAVYAVEATYSALASGALFVMVGTLRDRLIWNGTEEPHQFNLNGMFFNPQKKYKFVKAGGANPKEPKALSYTCRLLSSLTADVPPSGFQFVDTGNPNLQCVEVSSSGKKYKVLWVHGNAKNFDKVMVPAAQSRSLEASPDWVIEPVLDSGSTPTATRSTTARSRGTRSVVTRSLEGPALFPSQQVSAAKGQMPIAVKKERPVILMSGQA